MLPIAGMSQSFQELARQVATQSTQEVALRCAYDALAAKYRGYRMRTFLRIDRLFIHDFESLWRRNGFLHCHHMNYLLRTLLVSSGQFENIAITGHWTQIWILSPHQYLSVELKNGNEIEVDLWGAAYGIPFGEHAHGFAGGTIVAKEEL